MHKAGHRLSEIDPWQLELGHWIYFSTQSPKEDLQEVCGKHKYFLVITKNKGIYDPCWCYLVGTDGEVYNYSGIVFSLDKLSSDFSLTQQPSLRLQGCTVYKALKDHIPDEGLQKVHEVAAKLLAKKGDIFHRNRWNVLSSSEIFTLTSTH